MAFVHLHNHTEYSLLDGATHIKDMVRRAADLGMPAVAITDHGVMSGVPELSDACDAVEKETGKRVKPIYGCEIYFTEDPEVGSRKRSTLYHMILLAKNNTGYHNLLKLVSESHVDNFYYRPRTTFDMLKRYSEGLIGTSACIQGIVPYHINKGMMEEAERWARQLAEVFEPGDFYIELQNQGLGPAVDKDWTLTQTQLNHKLTELARRLGLKTIATNDFHYLTQEDAQAQDIMLCIGMNAEVDNPNRMRFANDQFYMKTEEEMRTALADFPEACDNTLEVAEKCDVTLERDSILPRFPLPEGETEETYFRKQIEVGLEKRYGADWENAVIDGISVKERYEYEADVIIQQGFPAYFLIVQEYIEWARSQGIGVGPGRGSAAGAIVAYAMGITDIEPLSNGLLFERFLNPERVEMPDIDVDFDDERREEVIQHIKDVYGEDHIAGVITFGTLKAKNAVRDSARVLGMSYAAGDRVAKLIGDELGITIDEVMGWDESHPEKANPDLIAAYEQEDEVKRIIDAAHSIEGNIRGEGVHACATIICRDPMADHVPVKRDTKGGDIITQFDGHYTPDLGLLKMDFLGLRTLGVLSRACRNVNERFGMELVPEEIPIDDEAAFELMRGGNMDGLFQVESPLYVSLFKRLPPRTFSDVVASIALNRPGPLQSGMVDEYVEVASGRTQAHFYDERLRSILEETYGTMVYQEQIMQVSMAMSGFSAGKADKLRKAMGKKKISVMRELQEDWNQGAVDNGYSLEIAKKIWDDAEKFAEYAFNKSHSAAYAILVMRTAYLKAHYPHDYMAAVLSSYLGKNDRLIRYISSCTHSGIPVSPPDINRSNLEFTPTDEGIVFGLAGVRGVGAKVAELIIAEREANGPFTSLHDFVNRMDTKTFNRKTLEALVKSGAFDSTGYPRRQLMFFLDETPLLEDAQRRQKDKDAGQVSMFDMFGADESSGFQEDVPEPDGVEWDKRTLLAFEKEILNMYVSDHPVRPFENYLKEVVKCSADCATLAERDKSMKSGTFGGMISELGTKRTKRGTLMATFNLEDTSGSVECICFDYEKNRAALEDDAIVKLRGKFEVNDRGNQIVVFEAERLELGEEHMRVAPTQVNLTVASNELNSVTSQRLMGILAKHPGKCPVVLYVQQNDGRKMRAELPVTIDATNSLLRSEVADLLGRQSWKAS